MKISNLAVLALGVLALSALPSQADTTLSFSSHSTSETTSRTAGQYTLQVTMTDYQNQVAGVKFGTKFTVKTESPMQTCSATDYVGTPEKEYRRRPASGCQLIDNGNTVVFMGSNGDFVLAQVAGAGRSRHIAIRDASGNVIWERWGSAAYFPEVGGYRCKATVTDSAKALFKQEFTGRCYAFIGREIAQGVVMVSDTGTEIIIDVTDE